MAQHDAGLRMCPRFQGGLKFLSRRRLDTCGEIAMRTKIQPLKFLSNEFLTNTSAVYPPEEVQLHACSSCRRLPSATVASHSGFHETAEAMAVVGDSPPAPRRARRVTSAWSAEPAAAVEARLESVYYLSFSNCRECLKDQEFVRKASSVVN